MEKILLKKSLNYCKKVVNKEVEANRYVRRQCSKFLKDLEKVSKNEGDYIVDLRYLDKIETVLKELKFPEGSLKGQPILYGLTGWQSLIFVAFFGFRFRSNPKKRKYNKIVLFIARKNGKSFLVALFFVLLLMVEPDFSQFFSISTKSEKAKIIYTEMKKIIRVSGFNNRFRKLESGLLECKANGNTYLPLSKNVGDGQKPAVFVADEVGAFENNQGITSMEYGQYDIPHNNGAGFFISTAYKNESTVWYDIVEYSKKILDGKEDDESVFSLLYYAEDENKWFEDKALYQANPIMYDVPSIAEQKLKDRKEAISIQSKLSEYMVKNLNLFLNDGCETSLTNIDDVRACTINNYDFRGKEVVVGVDLSQDDDNTAVTIIHREKGKEERYIVQSLGFIPRDMVEHKEFVEKVPYSEYETKGWCKFIGDKNIDGTKVYDYIFETLKKEYGMKIVKVMYDRGYSDDFLECAIEKKTYNRWFMEVNQGHETMDNTVRRLQRYIRNRNICFVKNDLLERNLLNADVHRNCQNKRKIDKKPKDKNKKVDMVSALADALYYYVEIEPYKGSVGVA